LPEGFENQAIRAQNYNASALRTSSNVAIDADDIFLIN